MLFKIAVIISSILAGVRCCNIIKDVEAHVVLTDGSPLTVNINGCIERKAFLDGNKTRNVVTIDINRQSIPTLETDSIRHLLYLRSLTIRNSDLKTMELDIFRNTPKLETVDFSSNQIDVVRDGVYNYQDFKSVSLYDNQIHSMDDLVFSNMNLLTKVNVSYNKLKEFKGAWFYAVPSLISIDFQHNLIEEIPSRAFANITTVKDIFLNHNNIGTIARNAFGELRSLEKVDLSHNLLKTITANSFPRNFKINMLSLNANRFNSLKETLFSELSIGVISFDGNPWNCYCHRSILKLLELRGVIVKLSFECRDATIPTCAIGPVTQCEEEPNDALTNYYYQQMAHQKNSKCVRYLDH